MKNFIKFLNYLLFIILISCKPGNEIKFDKNTYDKNNLNGNWELVKRGVINDPKKIMFDVDPTSYNFKKLKIDIDGMIFHLTSFKSPIKEYPSKILIEMDTIKITSGTTVNNFIKTLIKEKIIYKISDDLEYLKLVYGSDNSIMIFKKAPIKPN